MESSTIHLVLCREGTLLLCLLGFLCRLLGSTALSTEGNRFLPEVGSEDIPSVILVPCEANEVGVLKVLVRLL
jgi:hypothetical protein